MLLLSQISAICLEQIKTIDKSRLKINASLVLFTPLVDTLSFIKGDNQIVLVAANNNDRHLESETLCNLCEREKVPYYIEPNVGHRMEVRNDLEKNLQTIRNAMEGWNGKRISF